MSKHRTGWFRSLYYYFDWEYESDNDIPDEKSVRLKQVLMRQVSLSKLKLKKVMTNPRLPPDLQPIKTKNKVIISDTLDIIDIKHNENIFYVPPRTSPINIVELSQKQKQSRYGYR